MMANNISPLACMHIPSPNYSLRTSKIDTITIHHMAGNMSIENCGNMFANKNVEASSNYGIGTDGRIACYVDEGKRSWCSANATNDQRAVTIEVANDGGAPEWHVSDTAVKSLVALIADICKRNGIPQLKWQNDKSLIGQIDKQNMTIHRWFSATVCCGDYLLSKHPYIVEEVNKLLSPPTIETVSPVPVSKRYEIKVTGGFYMSVLHQESDNTFNITIEEE